jgi:hypothetical protein
MSNGAPGILELPLNVAGFTLLPMVVEIEQRA